MSERGATDSLRFLRLISDSRSGLYQGAVTDFRAGSFDLIVKYFLAEARDIGQFVNETVQTVPGIRDTETLITFRAF